MSSRLQQKADLLIATGHLIGPVLRALENPEQFEKDERTRIYARFFSDSDNYIQHLLRGFCISGEPGHQYHPQYEKACEAVYQIRQAIHNEDIKILEIVCVRQQRIRDAITDIPVPIDSTIHEAFTPFSTFCIINDLLATSTGEIVWLDRYFSGTIFQRHLRNVPPGVPITLVTYPETKCTSPRDKKRYAEFMDMSRLFAQERGPSAYRLLSDDSFHDRWLQCGEKLFLLGDSIKELGTEKTFTISRLDSSPVNRQHFTDARARGTEIFGAHNTTHP